MSESPAQDIVSLMEHKNLKLPDRYFFQILAVGYGEDEDEALAYVFKKIAKGEETDVLDPEVVWEKDEAQERPEDFVWTSEIADS